MRILTIKAACLPIELRPPGTTLVDSLIILSVHLSVRCVVCSPVTRKKKHVRGSESYKSLLLLQSKHISKIVIIS